MIKRIETNRKTPVASFLACQSGTTAIEYGLIAGLIAVVIVGAMTAVGSNLVSNYYDQIAAQF